MKENKYLRLLSGGETIVIPPTDGTVTIVQQISFFTGCLDYDFVTYRTNVPGKPTKATPVQVFEMIRGGRFAKIFGGFGVNPEHLCLSQAQIVSFASSHWRWVRKDGCPTLFLFTVSDVYLIASMKQHRSGGPCASLYEFSDRRVWGAGCRYRFVVPQL